MTLSTAQIVGMAAELTSEDDRVRTRGCMLFSQVRRAPASIGPFRRFPHHTIDLRHAISNKITVWDRPCYLDLYVPETRRAGNDVGV